MVRKKIKVGDVFYIPFQENYYGFGQIVSDKSKGPKLYILFDHISSTIPDDLDNIIKKPILAIAHLDDFSIEKGRWIILDNVDIVLKNIKYPNYVQGTIVEDYEGNFLKYATSKDFSDLGYRDTNSSGIFEDILLVKWKDNNQALKDYSQYLFDSNKWIKEHNEDTDVINNVSSGHKLNNVKDKDDFDEEESEKQIAIYFTLNEKDFGSDEDLSRKYEIEDLLDDVLQKIGLGDCDGGEIGNGEMIIFCYVNDLEKGLRVIKKALQERGYLEGARFSY